MCDKTNYASHRAASQALKWLVRNKRGRLVLDYWQTVQVYYCKRCGAWHIGHTRREHRLEETTWNES